MVVASVVVVAESVIEVISNVWSFGVFASCGPIRRAAKLNILSSKTFGFGYPSPDGRIYFVDILQ